MTKKKDDKKPENKIEQLENENAELKDSLKRLAADFDNFRKRKAQESIESTSLATHSLITEIFPVLDNFRRASEHTPLIEIDDRIPPTLTEDELSRINAYFEGVRQIEKQLEKILNTAGLEHIETLNQPFDHNTMEAVSYETHPELPEGTVIDELEGGYTFGNKVIRPAKVRVSKGQK